MISLVLRLATSIIGMGDLWLLCSPGSTRVLSTMIHKQKLLLTTRCYLHPPHDYPGLWIEGCGYFDYLKGGLVYQTISTIRAIYLYQYK